jgi:predicted transcriptional regulator
VELQISPELQAKLDRIAEQQGRDTQSLVREAIERLVDYDSWFIAEVKKGLAQVERGETLGHEEVGVLLEKFLAEKRQRV